LLGVGLKKKVLRWLGENTHALIGGGRKKGDRPLHEKKGGEKRDPTFSCKTNDALGGGKKDRTE